MRIKPAILASLPLVALFATAVVRAEQVQVIGRQDAWTVYRHETAEVRLCFAALQPRLSEPTTAKRDPIYLYITTWPGDGVSAEVSIKLGYTARKGSPVTLAIGTAAFRLATKDDRAFVPDGAEEKRLLEALRKAATMTVSATSERGTGTKDTFALTGTGAALDKLAQACG